MSRRDEREPRPTGSGRAIPAAVRMLARLLPAAFRSRHEAALLATVADQHAARARGRGTMRRALLWLPVAVDLVMTAVVLRAPDARREAAPHHASSLAR